MNHPYSGAASYIYANDFNASAEPSLHESDPRVLNASRNPVPGKFIYLDRSRKIYNYYHYSPEDRLKIDLRIKARQDLEKLDLNRPLPPIPLNEGSRNGREDAPSQRPSASTHSHSHVHSSSTHTRLPSVPTSLPETPHTKHRFRIHLNLSPFRFSLHKRLTWRRSDHRQHRDSWTSRNSLSGWRWSKSISMTTEGKEKTIVRRFRRWLSMRAPAFSGSGHSQSMRPHDEELSRTGETTGILRQYKGKGRRKQGRRVDADNGGANLSTSIMSV